MEISKSVADKLMKTGRTITVVIHFEEEAGEHSIELWEKHLRNEKLCGGYIIGIADEDVNMEDEEDDCEERD